FPPAVMIVTQTRRRALDAAIAPRVQRIFTRSSRRRRESELRCQSPGILPAARHRANRRRLPSRAPASRANFLACIDLIAARARRAGAGRVCALQAPAGA